MYVFDLLASSHHHNRNDTTGHTPIPELPHQKGLVAHGAAGTRTLWVVFAIMLIATICFWGAAFSVNKKNRLFHHLTAMITAFAAISYYCMASGIGSVLVRAPGDHAFREVLYARYLDWIVTTPLLLVDLALLAGIPLMDVFLLVIADLSMIVTGLVGGLHPHFKLRWGLFAFSCFFLVYIIYGLVVPGYSAAARRSEKVGKVYIGLSVYTVILWSAYPIVWALTEGTNYMKSNNEILAYAVLDVLAKAGFGAVLLLAHGSIKEANVALPDWLAASRGAKGYGAVSTEES